MLSQARALGFAVIGLVSFLVACSKKTAEDPEAKYMSYRNKLGDDEVEAFKRTTSAFRLAGRDTGHLFCIDSDSGNSKFKDSCFVGSGNSFYQLEYQGIDLAGSYQKEEPFGSRIWTHAGPSDLSAEVIHRIGSKNMILACRDTKTKKRVGSEFTLERLGPQEVSNLLRGAEFFSLPDQKDVADPLRDICDTVSGHR